MGITVGGNPATTEDFRIGEAGRAEAPAAEGGLQQRPVERVLITAKPGSGRLDPTAADAAAKDVADRMRGLDEVRSVADPVHAANGTAAVQKTNPDLRVEETGSPSIGKGVDKLRGDDLSRTEVIAPPVTLITLLLVFSSLVMALVPLLLALSSINAAIGLSVLASHVFPDAGVGTDVILLIGLAVGVDYTLFHLKREREERARAGRSPEGRPSRPRRPDHPPQPLHAGPTLPPEAVRAAAAGVPTPRRSRGAATRTTLPGPDSGPLPG